jgi:PRTRC genetic system ParB family protein
MQVTGLQAGAGVSAAVVDATLATLDNATQTAPAAVPATPNKATANATADTAIAPVANDPTAAPLKGEPGIVKLAYIVQGNNPRTYFDEKEMTDLIESVRTHGVMQAISVRVIADNMFQIIAGERRYRAAQAAFGDDFDMPVLKFNCTEDEARVLSHIENTIRADMSPTEEAVSAAQILAQVRGDRAEAARLLSWSPSKLESRLALMNCSEPVRKALNERKIKLGHAELLAALAKEGQDKLLAPVIERGLSVSDLKAVIEKAAHKLSAAKFDKKDCAGCQHNSSVQGTMFAEAITDGGCTNATCYKAKTEEHLEQVKDSLKDEYPVIKIVRVGDNFAQVKIRADGKAGVGEEQEAACRGCSNFGAAVSALPEHMATVFKDQCFDPVCNQKKVAENIRAQQQAEAEAKAASAPAAGGAAAKGSSKGPAAGADKAKGPGKAQATVSEGEKVKAYRENLWRTAMKRELSKSYEVSVPYLVALAITGNIRHVSQDFMKQVFEKIGDEKCAKDLMGVTQQTHNLDAGRMEMATKMIAVSAMFNLPVAELQSLAKHIKLDLTKHWKMDADFLNLFTKSEIQVIAESVGLDKAYGDGFKKLFNEKKEPLIQALLGVANFDFSAKIPPVIMYK